MEKVKVKKSIELFEPIEIFGITGVVGGRDRPNNCIAMQSYLVVISQGSSRYAFRNPWRHVLDMRPAFQNATRYIMRERINPRTINRTHQTALPLFLPSSKSGACNTGKLSRRVVVGDSHVQRAATVAEILGREHGALLADEEGGGVDGLGGE